MVHRAYNWKSNDGISLFGQSWMPEGTPRALINYVHGFKDHSSRFEKWALRLTDNGYGVIAIDLRGHGRSEGRRGYATGFGSYVQDVSVLCQRARELFGNSPQILYGQSLGGSIVANYLISESLLPAASVITSPWFTLTHKPPMLKMTLAKAVRFLLPGLLVSSDLDAAGLSHDKEVIAQYLHDPLVHNSILPRLFFEIEQNGIKASKSIYKINVPLLVMHGTDDPITSFRQTRDFVMNAGNLTTFKEWPGAYHELHNDTDEKEVFIFLLQWLNKQISEIS
jgi:alpha-beta hydrolase superfamily lysophospholipase